MDNWIFIFCEKHDEYGSEDVHAFTDEAKFIAFVKQSVADCVDDLTSCIKKAKQKSWHPTFVHKEKGWGGPHIFVVTDGAYNPPSR